jgi:hypothetical protein
MEPMRRAEMEELHKKRARRPASHDDRPIINQTSITNEEPMLVHISIILT